MAKQESTQRKVSADFAAFLANQPFAPSALELVETAATLQSRAYRDRRSQKYSFTPIFLAAVTAQNPYSRALRQSLDQHQIPLKRIASSIGLDDTSFDSIANAHISESPPEYPRLDPDPAVYTPSAEAILRTAARYAVRSAESAVESRHLIAALIYEPGFNHPQQYESWGVDRKTLSRAFINIAFQLHLTEAPIWQDLHALAFTEIIAKPRELEALSNRGVSDKWISSDSDDRLGYAAYAEAIASAIRKTEPPFTISIQAPWGGGKTSLMRMIRARFDPPLNLASNKDDRRLRTGEILGILRNPQPLAPSNTDNLDYLTIWFNAWKYQNSEQLWAGLADAIIRGYADSLPSQAERERFWLQLNLRRLDAAKIRSRIWQHVFDLTFQFTRHSIAAAAVFFTGAGFLGVKYSVPAALATLLAFPLFKFAYAWFRVEEKEPAPPSLNEFLQAPNYSAKTGFFHEAEQDLRAFFDGIVVPNNRKLILFVDDLDRCSPPTVAAVFEGINMFLAGDFSNCFVILAMDPAIVAAALDEAHSKMVAATAASPSRDSDLPLGWRFMDKFIQLPFVIPAPSEPDINSLANSLLAPLPSPAPAQSTPASTNPTPSPAPAHAATDSTATLVSAERIRELADQLTDHSDTVREFPVHTPELRRPIACTTRRGST